MLARTRSFCLIPHPAVIDSYGPRSQPWPGKFTPTRRAGRGFLLLEKRRERWHVPINRSPGIADIHLFGLGSFRSRSQALPARLLEAVESTETPDTPAKPPDGLGLGLLSRVSRCVRTGTGSFRWMNSTSKGPDITGPWAGAETTTRAPTTAGIQSIFLVEKRGP